MPEEPGDLPAPLADDDHNRGWKPAGGNKGREVCERPVHVAQRVERTHDQMAAGVSRAELIEQSARHDRCRLRMPYQVAMEKVPTRMISPAYPRSSNCWRISLWNREAIRTTDGTPTSVIAFGGDDGDPVQRAALLCGVIVEDPGESNVVSAQPSAHLLGRGGVAERVELGVLEPAGALQFVDRAFNVGCHGRRSRIRQTADHVIVDVLARGAVRVRGE